MDENLKRFKSQKDVIDSYEHTVFNIDNFIKAKNKKNDVEAESYYNKLINDPNINKDALSYDISNDDLKKIKKILDNEKYDAQEAYAASLAYKSYDDYINGRKSRDEESDNNFYNIKKNEIKKYDEMIEAYKKNGDIKKVEKLKKDRENFIKNADERYIDLMAKSSAQRDKNDEKVKNYINRNNNWSALIVAQKAAKEAEAEKAKEAEEKAAKAAAEAEEKAAKEEAEAAAKAAAEAEAKKAKEAKAAEKAAAKEAKKAKKSPGFIGSFIEGFKEGLKEEEEKEEEKAEEEKAGAKKEEKAGAKKDPLNGLSTDEWVKKQFAAGLTEEAIKNQYKAFGYSIDGPKLLAAINKYKPFTNEEINQEAERQQAAAEQQAAAKQQEVEEAPIKEFSKNLNRFVVQAYLNGDFGKKSDPNAIVSMGYFILDKIGAAIVNASQTARGLTPSEESQWRKVLNQQTDLLGKRATAKWFLSLTPEEQAALYKTNMFGGTTAKNIYENTNDNAVSRAEQRDMLEIASLKQSQKATAQANINALIQRKAEIQNYIANLRSDQGWDAYSKAVNAYVGTAKGLRTLGITEADSSSNTKEFNDSLTAGVGTGFITKQIANVNIANNSSWINSSAEVNNKSNALTEDAFAYSRFKDGDAYGNAARNDRKAAITQLINDLKKHIEYINSCIDSWSDDLGVKYND